MVFTQLVDFSVRESILYNSNQTSTCTCMQHAGGELQRTKTEDGGIIMDIVEILRIETGPQGTFGVLRIDKWAFCVTLELPDYHNQRNVSCILAGQYMCHKYISTKFRMELVKVDDVHNRIGIAMHPGNTVADTEGCILLAEHYGKIKTGNQHRRVENSGATFRRFMQRVGQQFHLTITEHY